LADLGARGFDQRDLIAGLVIDSAKQAGAEKHGQMRVMLMQISIF
jgi:hypothetical protein